MFLAFVRLMRPADWIKNSFVLLAPTFYVASQFGESEPDQAPSKVGLLTLCAVVVFCLTASGFYAVNDAVDVESDRLHPIKRRRPIASGAVSPASGFVFGLLLMATGLIIAYAVDVFLGAVVSTYVLLQIAYNLKLKRVLFVDVIVLSSGFVLRAASGAAAISIPISVWLVQCVFFLCLYLALIKRLCDISSSEAHGDSQWRTAAGYDDPMELNWLLAISGVMAVMMYLMYALSGHARSIFGDKTIAFALMTPLVVIAIHRFYHRARRGVSDSPLQALVTDRAVTLSVLLFAAGIILSLFFPWMEEALREVFFVDRR